MPIVSDWRKFTRGVCCYPLFAAFGQIFSCVITPHWSRPAVRVRMTEQVFGRGWEIE
jgi:hypothetical protein